MFAIKKLVLVAACVALALGPAAVAAEPESSTRLRIHVYETTMKAADEASSGDTAGGSAGNDNGGSGDSDDSDDGTDKPFCTVEGEYPVSVEYVEGAFCVTGSPCVADAADGVCPGPQSGLPFGSRCDKVASGVYGCTVNREMPGVAGLTTAAPTGPYSSPGGSQADSDDTAPGATDAPPTSQPVCTGEGEYPVSVEYAEGVFCVTGSSCVADTVNGVCPGPQSGLPFGSRCDRVASGVYGCTVNREAPGVTEPTTTTPTGAGGASSGSLDDSDDAKTPVDSADFCPGADETEMSVEGAQGIFCITGQACVADIADGACPDAQKNLPYGSRCDIVASGVYGCKANEPPAKKHHKKTSASTAKKSKHDKKHESSKKALHGKVRGHGSSKSKLTAATTKKKNAHHASTKSKSHRRSRHDTKTAHHH